MPIAHAQAETSAPPGRGGPEIPCIGQKRFKELYRQLGDEHFKVRQTAEDELHQRLHLAPVDVPNPVEAACYDAWSREADPEVRVRLQAVLTDFAVNLWGPNPYLGIVAVPEKSFNEDGKLVTRLRIQSVVTDSPADRAELREGDLVIGIGDLSLDGQTEAGKLLSGFLGKKQPGDRVAMSVSRNGQISMRHIVLGHSPWVIASPDSDEPASPPDPEYCLRVYLAKKRGGG